MHNTYARCVFYELIYIEPNGNDSVSVYILLMSIGFYELIVEQRICALPYVTESYTRSLLFPLYVHTHARPHTHTHAYARGLNEPHRDDARFFKNNNNNNTSDNEFTAINCSNIIAHIY